MKYRMLGEVGGQCHASLLRYLLLLAFTSVCAASGAQTPGEIRAGNDQVGNDVHFSSNFSLEASVTIGIWAEGDSLPIIDRLREQAFFTRQNNGNQLIKYDLKTFNPISSQEAPGRLFMLNPEKNHLYLVSEESTTGPQTLHKYSMGPVDGAPYEVARLTIPREYAAETNSAVVTDPVNDRAWFVKSGDAGLIVQLQLGSGDTSPTLAGTLAIGPSLRHELGGGRVFYDSVQGRLYLNIFPDLGFYPKTKLLKIAVETGPNPLRLMGEMNFADEDQPAFLVAVDSEDHYGVLLRHGRRISRLNLEPADGMPEIASTLETFGPGDYFYGTTLDTERDILYTNAIVTNSDTGPSVMRLKIHDGAMPPEFTGMVPHDGKKPTYGLEVAPSRFNMYGWWQDYVSNEIGFRRYDMTKAELKTMNFGSTIRIDQPMQVDAIRFYSKLSTGTIQVALYTTGTQPIKVWSSYTSNFADNNWAGINASTGGFPLRLQPGVYALVWHIDTNGNIPAFSANADADSFAYIADETELFPPQFHPPTVYVNNRFTPIIQKGAWSVYLEGRPAQITSPLRVGTDFREIQSALVFAKDGDSIIVPPGIYRQNIYMLGKNVILSSMDPDDEAVVASTIIDGGLIAPVVNFSGKESTQCILQGFTIRNGYGRWGVSGAGGIGGNQYSATIRQNHIIGNRGSGIAGCDGLIEGNIISTNYAAGLYKYGFEGGGLLDCNGVIRNNHIIQNFALWGGGLAYCNGLIEGNLIEANVAAEGGGHFGVGRVVRNVIRNNRASGNGGAVLGCNGPLDGNVIYGNQSGTAPRLGPLVYNAAVENCRGPVRNNTIWDNYDVNSGSKIQLSGASGPITNNVIWATNYTSPVLRSSSIPNSSCIPNWTGGGVGNISSDPRLVNPAAGDFRLSAQSPCLDRGQLIPEVTHDLDGRKRGADILHRELGDGSNYDIGAYEAHLFTVSPNGGETWRIGQRAFVEWTANLDSVGSAVGLELWRNGVFAAYLGLDWSANAQGRREITVPNVQPGNDYQIRAISLWDGHYWDFSDGNLSIVNDPNWRSAAEADWLLYR